MRNHDARFRHELAEENEHLAHQAEEHACAGDCGATVTRDTIGAKELPEGVCCPRCALAIAGAVVDGVIGRAHYSRRAIEALLRGEARDAESYDVSASGRACAAYTAELVEATSRVQA